jgi:hypothetical protein
LQERAEELLGQITPELMERVYPQWIERLDQVIRTNWLAVDVVENNTGEEC